MPGLAGTDGGRGAETTIDTITVTADGVTVDGVEIVGEFSSPSTGSFNVGVLVQGDDFPLVNSVLNGPDGDFALDTVAVLAGSVTGLDIGNNLITGYLRGVYLFAGDATGSVHDNRFEGFGLPNPAFEGMGNGIVTNTSHVDTRDNVFDGIWAGVLNVGPLGPTNVDLNDFITGNVFTNNLGRAADPDLRVECDAEHYRHGRERSVQRRRFGDHGCRQL